MRVLARHRERVKPRESPWMDGIKDAFKGAEVVPVYKKFKIKKPANNGDQTAMMMPPMALGKLPAALALLKGYKIGFLNSASNDELRYSFKDGGKSMAEVLAVVMTKSDAVYDDTIPSNDKKAFARRFVLATKADYEAKMKEANGGR